ncbi:MAG: SAM-dependent methyltransferase [Candidatus Dadabacteria bacterium]|nr:SAM-dependent methyltransferase [Candidatus Dadabacteria bacterium]|tara:strand:+ start:22157 stop:23176 length:1020 start_codon:yes stop_codon:yes gene_type:complete
MKIYFDQYVRNALYDKGGYYHDHSSVKEKRDFITSPQVSDLFGFFISKYISLNFSKFFKKKNFSIVELGSNDGLLSLQILDYLKSNYLELYENINYIIIEQNSYLKKNILLNLKDHQEKIEVTNKLKNSKKIKKSAFFVCNEFFDSLPFHRCIYRDGSFFEIAVEVDSKKNFLPVEVEIRTEVLNLIKNIGLKVDENFFFEFPSDEYFDFFDDLKEISENFLFLIFDYGEKSQTLNIGKNPNGSARCFYKNQISNNFYENFQKQDITFSVNFQLLKESFTSIKAKEISFETQSKFLLTNGFVEMLEAYRPPDLLELQNIKKLVSPSSMGEAFKVMLLAR